MGLRSFLGFIFILFSVFLLGLYWFFPLGNVDLTLNDKGSSNFSFSTNSSIQFYENMRYSNKEITYRIYDCPLKKRDDMLRAVDIINDKTILELYPVESNEEISITCSDENKFNGNLFVAGEGGPVNITKTSNFYIINSGKVLLLRESSCSEPNVGIHELFHALGFEHSENKNNIMYPTSNCNQEISEDMIELLDNLYSIPSLSDLDIVDSTISLNGKYLDAEIVVKNNGLKESGNSRILIYADEKLLKEELISNLDIGYGVTLTFTNVLVSKINVEKIKIIVENDNKELDKNNNEVVFMI